MAAANSLLTSLSYVNGVHSVTIHDGRSFEDVHDVVGCLTRRGFCLIRNLPTTLPLEAFWKHFTCSAMERMEQVITFDADGSAVQGKRFVETYTGDETSPSLVALYQQETANALKRVFPTAEVAIAFNQLVRTTRRIPHDRLTDDDDDSVRPPHQPPAFLIHSDFTDAFALRRYADFRSTRIIDHPFASCRYTVHTVNVWRNINPHESVQQHPLAVLDKSTVRPEDVTVSRMQYNGLDVEQHNLRHRNDHRWAYFKEMEPHELLVFQQGTFIMERDEGEPGGPHWKYSLSSASEEHPQTVLHTAVKHTTPHSLPRDSCENRFVVLVPQEKEGH